MRISFESPYRAILAIWDVSLHGNSTPNSSTANNKRDPPERPGYRSNGFLIILIKLRSSLALSPSLSLSLVMANITTLTVEIFGSDYFLNSKK
jgi:hypothetical protein